MPTCRAETTDKVLIAALSEVFDMVAGPADCIVFWDCPKNQITCWTPSLLVSNVQIDDETEIQCVTSDRTFNVPTWHRQVFYAYPRDIPFNIQLPKVLPFARDVYDCLWGYDPPLGARDSLDAEFADMRPAETREGYEKVSLFCPVTRIHNKLIHPTENRLLTRDELERIQGGPVDCVPKGFAEWLTNQMYFCVTSKLGTEQEFYRYDRYSDKIVRHELRQHNLTGLYGNFDERRFAKWKQQHAERLGLYGK